MSRAVGAGSALLGGWLLLTQPVRQGATTWVVAATVAAGVGVVLRPGRPPARFRWAPAAACALASVLTAAWVGANTAEIGWFGGLQAHGPREVARVALTFDDGPDVDATLAVRDILDAFGVKATFFTVGRALHGAPDVSASLLADGQLLANHSYAHDYWHWLDPRYPELARTQREFAADVGVCPTFFRPPHGQHTPLMARAVDRQHMEMVTWDVSARDWSSHDGAQVARTVLGRVRRGSIILLHDGRDGHLHADRSVLLTALPLILDGLRARGLEPVRLDQLLGKAPYAGRCAPPAGPTGGSPPGR